MIIALNASIRPYLERLAADRTTFNRSRSTINHRIGQLSDAFVDFQGLSGEFAFAQLMNTDPDIELHNTNTIDCTLKSGRRVDVKTTHHERGRLLCRPTSKEKDVDLFVLMVGEFPKFRFAGWCYHDELVSDERLIWLSETWTYALSQRALRSPESLIELETSHA
jgi:hypothetical protein